MRAFNIIAVVILLLLTGCSQISGKGKFNKVGMLVESTIHDQAWGQQGYKGLLSIQEEYGTDIYFKEGIKTQPQTAQAVEELVSKGVNVIFGHSNAYGKFFQELHRHYPDVHFIYFNGQFSAENVTSLNFNATAMGFFGGMVAGRMTETEEIGLIAAFEWQPEVEGFYEGVMYQNPNADVHIAFTNSWDNKEKALKIYERMQAKGADVFYPAGDIFSIPLIHKIRENQQFAIGYVSDQSSIAKNTVLTSTVQQVDRVYNIAMDRLVKNKLPGKPLSFDFQEGAITMGKFSPEVPQEFRDKIERAVERYKETGKLPNQ